MSELEKLIAELDALDPDDLDDFHGETLDLAQWDRYQQIVNQLLVLPDKCEYVTNVRYLTSPIPTDEIATATVTLSQFSMFNGEVKAALADAVVLCDSFHTSALENKVRLSFVVNHVWKECAI
jgi:hypothetical protein